MLSTLPEPFWGLVNRWYMLPTRRGGLKGLKEAPESTAKIGICTE